MRPFVDFYRENKISPVSQDISDLGRHFERRASLYRALGVAPALLEGKSAIEFGPGSGHNALYTCSLHPRRFVSVDGNPTGIAAMRELFESLPWLVQPEQVESYIEDFRTPERFDVVICEGVIQQQRDPAAFTRHVASFVRPGGVFLTTTFDGASALADQMRRLLNLRLPREWSVERRVAALEPEMAPHLAALPGMSRPIVDYLHDNIVQPMIGPLFSLVEMVPALAGEFDVYGCSPSFTVDWRWYKTLVGDARRFNERIVETYLRNVANFIDCRVELPPHDCAAGVAALEACTRYYEKMQAAQDGGPAAYDAAVEALAEAAGELERLSPRAAASVREFIAYLGGDGGALRDCFSFWGRGQQNVSFIRKSAMPR
jgi:SAM-dependent methyltransferase